jgi:CHAD domain-containing protein
MLFARPPFARRIAVQTVKTRSIDLTIACGVDDAMRRIAIVRFAELLTLSPALRTHRPCDLHDFRIACKRLRYALERFTSKEPSLLEAASRLSQLQEALGNWRDREQLLTMVPALELTARRIANERDDALSRANALWRDAFATYGPFEGLMRFTGLGYGLGDGEAPGA